MFAQDLHCRTALATLFFTFALGAWGALNFFRGQGLGANYLGAVVIGEILVLVQAVVGILLVLSGQLPSDGLHFLYGVTIAIAWPGAYTYTHGETGRREMGIYALVSFFAFGLGVRALMTGSSAAVCLPR